MFNQSNGPDSRPIPSGHQRLRAGDTRTPA
ncbi:hypothetical protein SAM23877_5288 [Streptomyces ambofaciens ATCC 23877]|uniref:Uncharacterized protein n=1 Tax=Streptomyces ambofaciens (strain ATCC 23877 / 3486 / DSM 40053 / JCM 4204 / NBRC 12836 / NRRL B-2516) TaxID=278992 RepID=A0A0K2AZE1_STRA7|nr:hypothetical protein SAM23877_5288 [Streptomyces ambofaciens ATCC 23877]